MARPRQQRAARNRRRVYPAQPAQPLLCFLIYVQNIGNTVTCRTVYEKQPPIGSGTPIDMLLTGLPKFAREITADLATSVVRGLTVGELIFTFPGDPIDPAEFFTIGPYDPSLRTAEGGWCAPGQIRTPA